MDKPAIEGGRCKGIDALLSSMQFDGANVPNSENGKGAVAYMKYV